MKVTGMLCFVDSDWLLIGGSFTTRGVDVLGPKRACARIQQPGELNPDAIAAIHRHLAEAFPIA